MATEREDEWVRQLREIVLKHVDSDRYAVFIYGSRAAGTAVRSSDFDIGIWGDAAVPVSILARIREDIDESDIPFHYDLVDFSRVDESFKTIALQHIIPWNQSIFFAEKLESSHRP
jgi:predicted nucleotidyltransferase